ILEFDNSSLSLVEIFERQKAIFDDIYAHTAFGDLNLADGQTLKNMLDGIVKNKLAVIDNKPEKQAKPAETSIQELFVQKIAITAQNTAESTPFYNIGVADTQPQSESWAFPRNLDNYKLISTPQGVVPVLRVVPIDNSIVGVDWVTFSFCQSSFGEKYVHLQPEQVDLSVGDAIETWLD
ncbi:MAG: replication protein, partial [Acinetobacter sp.]